PRVAGEPVDCVLQVFQLLHAELLVSGPGRADALAAGAPRIDAEDDDSGSGEGLVLQSAAVVAFADGRGVRPCVGEGPDRVFLRRVEVGWFDERAFQIKAVAGLDLHALVWAEAVFLAGVDWVRVERPDQ